MTLYQCENFAPSVFTFDVHVHRAAIESVNIEMKRAREEQQEFGCVSEVTNPSPNAKIHGVVQGLSPMKKSRNCSYFDGELTDGREKMRLFGFDSGVRRKLEESYESEGPVSVVLSNCEVKRGRRGEQLEVSC